MTPTSCNLILEPGFEPKAIWFYWPKTTSLPSYRQSTWWDFKKTNWIIWWEFLNLLSWPSIGWLRKIVCQRGKCKSYSGRHYKAFYSGNLRGQLCNLYVCVYNVVNSVTSIL